jgi:hypothetical protein
MTWQLMHRRKILTYNQRFSRTFPDLLPRVDFIQINRIQAGASTSSSCNVKSIDVSNIMAGENQERTDED